MKTKNICQTCGHEKDRHSRYDGSCLLEMRKDIGFGRIKKHYCPCKKFVPMTVLFKPTQKKQVTLPSVVVSEEIRE